MGWWILKIGHKRARFSHIYARYYPTFLSFFLNPFLITEEGEGVIFKGNDFSTKETPNVRFYDLIKKSGNKPPPFPSSSLYKINLNKIFCRNPVYNNSIFYTFFSFTFLYSKDGGGMRVKNQSTKIKNLYKICKIMFAILLQRSDQRFIKDKTIKRNPCL